MMRKLPPVSQLGLFKFNPRKYSTSATTSPFLLGPGKHLKTSPVLGSRCGELAKIYHSSKQYPELAELGKKIYDIKYRLIIPAKDRELANQFSRDIFLAYIRRYANKGINETNIVNWVTSSSALRYGNNRCTVEKTSKIKYLEACVESDNGPLNEEKGYFFPPYIVAQHEVMHIEEHARNFFHFKYSGETLTTIKTIILLDEVNKKIRKLDPDLEINYRKTISVGNNKIALGQFVNFYRKLENKHKNLSEALTSKESLEFLRPSRSVK